MGGLSSPVKGCYRPAPKDAGFHFVQVTLHLPLSLDTEGSGYCWLPLRRSSYTFTLFLPLMANLSRGHGVHSDFQRKGLRTHSRIRFAECHIQATNSMAQINQNTQLYAIPEFHQTGSNKES